MSPEMQGMCIGVKSMSGSVAVSFFLPPLAEFSLPNSWNVFFNIYIFVFFSFSEVYRGTLGTLTAWKLANVHMHDNLIQISKTFMDLFRRDSTW